MNRKNFITKFINTALAGFGASLVESSCYSTPMKVKKRAPNVVFILIDDMGYTDGSCLGSDYYRTPNLDLLAAAGMKFTDALYNAGISRFRPILLTTITTTAGLYPIILEKSFQAQFLRPMAVALAYGVLIGTMFILLFFPALIMFLNDIRVARRWLWTGVKPSREEMQIAVKHMQTEKEIES